MRLPASNDTRLLVAGVVAFLALVTYLGVAFADTHASMATASEVAPWTPYASKLVPVRRGRGNGFVVRVIPTKPGTYGGLVPDLVSQPPPGRRFVVGLWLRGAPPGPVGVAIDEFSPGATSVYVVQTTVHASPRWHHFTFRARIEGSWLGLGMYVSRQTEAAGRTWFAVRGLTAAFLSG